MTLDKKQLHLMMLKEKLPESRTSTVNKMLSVLLLEKTLTEFHKTAMMLEKPLRTLKVEMLILEPTLEPTIFKSKIKKIICSELEKISKDKAIQMLT